MPTIGNKLFAPLSLLRLALTTALLGGLAGSARAQVQWVDVASPGPRAGHGAAFVAQRGRLVVTGGGVLDSDLGTETWEWDGAEWHHPTPAQAPPPLSRVQLVHAPALGACVLTGWHQVGWTLFHQCWTWNGTAWAQLPDVPELGQLGYDGLAQRVLVLTPSPGLTSTVVVREFDGSQWVVRPTTGGVPGGSLRRWAFDAVRNCIVMPVAGQVHELRGSTWVSVAATGPSIATGIWHDVHTVTWDARLGGVVVCGGAADQFGQTLGDVWVWNGTQWAQLPSFA